MKFKQIIFTFLIACTGGFCTYILMSYFEKDKPQTLTSILQEESVPVKLVSTYAENIDFTVAAEKSLNAVVHVKTQYSSNNQITLFEYFFGARSYEPQPVTASGSGVVITEDGYIITNNHVIENTSNIEVVLNDNRSFPAKLIGTDPSTDIALLKIEQNGLPFLTYGDSDALKIGEWVLAVGNPFNLTSTVTAGIVSAKARNINILNKEYAIESFIQTDAAVNLGNSGGALVNTKGELIGINTAIASQTGSFSGYSFAVPISIASKVVSDLIEYGSVQRGLLGVQLKELTSEEANTLGVDKLEGVFLSGINEGGAADLGKLKPGDIILSVGNVKVNKISELQEQISQFRPGDEVLLSIKRNGKVDKYKVLLQNKNGGTEIIKTETIAVLGAKFEKLSEKELKALRLTHGVKVVDLSAGKLLKAGVRKGLIIININRKEVKTTDDINKILEGADGGVYIEGIYPNGTPAYYAFGLE